MDADKQEEITAFVLRSILLAKLYSDLRSRSSNVRIPRDTNIWLALWLYDNDIQRKTDYNTYLCNMIKTNNISPCQYNV